MKPTKNNTTRRMGILSFRYQRIHGCEEKNSDLSEMLDHFILIKARPIGLHEQKIKWRRCCKYAALYVLACHSQYKVMAENGQTLSGLLDPINN